MQPRPSFDRTLLIPIGAVLILAIGWILLISDLGGTPIPPTVVPSSFSSLEAVTLTATQSPCATATQGATPPTATGTSPDAYPGPPAETLASTSILITESLSTPSATRTPKQFQPLAAGKHDDTDPNIAYDRFWTLLKNPGTKNSYKGTIHASSGIGNQASFRFTGRRFDLGYLRGRNFGTVTVIVDDKPYSFHEQAFDLVWHSPQLSPGDHVVRIIHESGETINLDYIVIVN